MTNVRGRDKNNIYTKTGKQHKKDKTSQISSYEHKQFFQKTSLYILAVIMIQ